MKRERNDDRINETQQRPQRNWFNIEVPYLKKTRQFAHLNKTDLNKQAKCTRYTVLWISQLSHLCDNVIYIYIYMCVCV